MSKPVLLNLAQLPVGKKAIISDFTDEEMSVRLIEMGCLPGEEIRVDRIAPLGDPIAVTVSGYVLSMRKEEAATILVTLKPEHGKKKT